MDKRSTFRCLPMVRRGDGGAEAARADGIARITPKAKSGQSSTPGRPRAESTGSPPGRPDSQLQACSREKPLSPSHRKPVPQTDTGGRVEDTEALERLTVKELGKLAP